MELYLTASYYYYYYYHLFRKFFRETLYLRVPYEFNNWQKRTTVQYCWEKYGINFDNVIVIDCNFSVNNINNMYFTSFTDDTLNTINLVHELIKCRDGSFYLCYQFLDKTDIYLFIDYLYTS